jgi:SMC interacting uncharacterized protein involved in chromosome segregation
VTTREDIATVAGQLADLTQTVEKMQRQLVGVVERANSQQDKADRQQARADVQQERIDLAAKELADVSVRLQAAADALRQAI